MVLWGVLVGAVVLRCCGYCVLTCCIRGGPPPFGLDVSPRHRIFRKVCTTFHPNMRELIQSGEMADGGFELVLL